MTGGNILQIDAYSDCAVAADVISEQNPDLAEALRATRMPEQDALSLVASDNGNFYGYLKLVFRSRDERARISDIITADDDVATALLRRAERVAELTSTAIVKYLGTAEQINPILHELGYTETIVDAQPALAKIA
jgi:hypothetical protein